MWRPLWCNDKSWKIYESFCLLRCRWKFPDKFWETRCTTFSLVCYVCFTLDFSVDIFYMCMQIQRSNRKYANIFTESINFQLITRVLSALISRTIIIIHICIWIVTARLTNTGRFYLIYNLVVRIHTSYLTIPQILIVFKKYFKHSVFIFPPFYLKK